MQILTLLKPILADIRRAVVLTLVGGIGLYAYCVVGLKLASNFLILHSKPITIICGLWVISLASYFIGKSIGGKKYIKQNYKKIIKDDILVLGTLKWRIQIYSDKTYDIEDIPYCPNHNYKFVGYNFNYGCIIKGCDSNIGKSSLYLAYKQAQSILEYNIRNNNL